MKQNKKEEAKEIKKIMGFKDEEYEIKKEVKIQHDKKQFLIRFPKEIADILELKKGGKMEIKVKIIGDKVKDYQFIKK